MSNKYEVLQNKGQSNLCLRLTAQMFRQHSDLFLQQAAVLERVATDPQNPDSWKVNEPSPESVHESLLKENVSLIAKKSYESMLQIQKRVDFLERTMIRKGIKPVYGTRKAKIPVKRKVPKTIGKAFYHFLREHGPRTAASLGVTSRMGGVVRSKLLRIWSTMNPQERQPYLEKARAAKGEDSVALPPEKSLTADAKDAVSRDTISGGDEAQSDSDSSEDEKLSDSQDDDDDDDDSGDDDSGDDDSGDDDSGDEVKLMSVRQPEQMRQERSKKDD